MINNYNIMDYYKYLKHKTKYMELKYSQTGGSKYLEKLIKNII